MRQSDGYDLVIQADDETLPRRSEPLFFVSGLNDGDELMDPRSFKQIAKYIRNNFLGKCENFYE